MDMRRKLMEAIDTALDEKHGEGTAAETDDRQSRTMPSVFAFCELAKRDSAWLFKNEGEHTLVTITLPKGCHDALLQLSKDEETPREVLTELIKFGITWFDENVMRPKLR